MDEGAVVNVIPDAPCQGEPLAIAPKPQQIVGRMKMLHSHDFLIDDRSLVEIGSDVMAGGADKFHAPVIRAPIGIRAGK